jgi:hypothetical protein
MTNPIITHILNTSFTNTNKVLGFHSNAAEVLVPLAYDVHAHTNNLIIITHIYTKVHNYSIWSLLYNSGIIAPTCFNFFFFGSS